MYNQKNCADTASIFVKSIINSIHTPSNLEFNLFPNPANEQLIIQFRQNASIPIILTIYDCKGRMVYSYSSVLSSVNQKIDVSNMLPGIYLLNIQSPSAIYSNVFSVN